MLLRLVSLPSLFENQLADTCVHIVTIPHPVLSQSEKLLSNVPCMNSSDFCWNEVLATLKSLCFEAGDNCIDVLLVTLWSSTRPPEKNLEGLAVGSVLIRLLLECGGSFRPRVLKGRLMVLDKYNLLTILAHEFLHNNVDIIPSLNPVMDFKKV